MGFFLAVFLDAGIDLLGRHVFEADIEQGTRDRGHTLTDQQWIDRQVAGNIPALAVAVLAPCKVGQRTMQRLVGQCKLRLVHGQRIDVFGIVVKGTCIGANRLTPLRIGCLHWHTQHQRPKERPVENQASACSAELDFGIIGHEKI